MKRKKAFRPTPNQVQDAMKIVTGNKSNTTSKEVDDSDDKNIKEETGTIVSIDKNKIHGNGWKVKTNSGTYDCSCASNLYEIPKSKEQGGLLRPTSTVKCKIKINPLLRVATITEIEGSKKKKEKLNIDKWKHKDYDTTIIASLKSAVSVSDGAITFNYNDKSKVTIDDSGVKIEGSVQLDTDEFNINDESFDDLTDNTVVNDNLTTDDNDSIDSTTNDSISEMRIIETLDIDLNERIIGNILDQKQTPQTDQKRPLLSDENIDELNIYANGIITIKGRIQKGIRHINHVEKWIPQREKNIIDVTVMGFCDYCEYQNHSHIMYIDYCPVCKRWNVLSQHEDKVLCHNCYAQFCGSCGHYEGDMNLSNNLKKYENFNIDIIAGNCQYCNDKLPSAVTKQYVDYCPICKSWNVLHVDNDYLYCDKCDTYFCGNCGTQQSGYQNNSNFYEEKILYDTNYKEKMSKLFYIKES